VAKFNSFNEECTALGFEEEFVFLICLNSPSEAFKVRGQEMPSAENVWLLFVWN
jgi:hypothetical protein